jgi:hypothetical protein
MRPNGPNGLASRVDLLIVQLQPKVVRRAAIFRCVGVGSSS